MVKYTITYASLILSEINKKVKQNFLVDSLIRRVLLGRKSIERLNCTDEENSCCFSYVFMIYYCVTDLKVLKAL